MKRYPMKLSAISKTPVWGGTRLLQEWGKRSSAPTLGESWELSVRKEEKSVIRNGVYLGRTLESVFSENGFSARFPLLVKLIDARDDLSVQVHPNDDEAAEGGEDSGKTEMWYILEADGDSELVYGLSDGVTRSDAVKALQEGKIGTVLHRQKVHSGEVYFVPSGLVHAIGRGILLAEIQQNCDLTYRLYDYDRVDAAGNKRPLHVSQAEKVIRPFTEKEIAEIRFFNGRKTPNTLADCKYFSVRRITGETLLPATEKFGHLLCIGGDGTLVSSGVSYPVVKGDSYFLPPDTEVKTEGGAVLLYSMA